MSLSNTSGWEMLFVKYDIVNKVLFCQWIDNKVVSFISTLGASRTVAVKRRIRVRKVEFQINEALKRYIRVNF
jgi:hypothetical protein